jgi:hypothetical protein
MGFVNVVLFRGKWTCTPGSLDEELQHETRSGERSEFVGENPGWDQTSRDQSGDAHRTPATDPLREVADDGSADAGAGFHQNARG